MAMLVIVMTEKDRVVVGAVMIGTGSSGVGDINCGTFPLVHLLLLVLLVVAVI